MKINSTTVDSQLKGIENKKTDKLNIGSKSKDAGKLSKADIQESAKVNLSSKAQLMKKAEHIARTTNADTASNAKIEHLQKLIDSGNYKVDAGAVADKLVDDQLLFPS